jgi:hypothetical protein
MTEEQMKEEMSRGFLKILAHGHGFKVLDANADHGVDMTLCPVTKRIEPSGKTRYLDSQYKLDLQLKATTGTSIVDAGTHIKYDLEVKSFNDLVYRKDELLPLHLVLVVLDSAPPKCVSLDLVSLILAGRAYWYLPADDAVPTENESRVRISIPKVNQLASTFVHDRFGDLGIYL